MSSNWPDLTAQKNRAAIIKAIRIASGISKNKDSTVYGFRMYRTRYFDIVTPRRYEKIMNPKEVARTPAISPANDV